MSGRIREIEAHEFQAEVLDQEFAVVDFYSDECPPCEALAPKYHALSELYGDRVRFVKIFRQKNRDLALSLGVKSSPTVLFYRRGERVGPVLVGGIRRSQIAREIETFLAPGEIESIRARTAHSRTECDILVLGGGPAGLTAAIYAAQAKRRTILLDPALTGGQITITHLVANYPGFPEPVAGWQLGHHMSEQARRAGAEIRQAVELTRIDLDAREVEIDGVETFAAKRIILATGSSPRLLGVPGEREYRGKGISYCATCDGKYFEGKELVVVGGGSSALEEAQFLTTFASKVTIVHRGPRESLRATGAAQEKALSNPKIAFRFEHEIRAFRKLGDGMEVVAQDKRSGEETVLKTDGVFIFIGMRPNLENFEGRFTLDEWGYVVTDPLQRTGVPGIFAVGDISAKPFRQITIAAAEGTIAGIQAAKELLEEDE